MNQPDMLEQVIAALIDRGVPMTRVSEQSGVPYDTVLRVKNREGGSTYETVKRLHEHLFSQAEKVPA